MNIATISKKAKSLRKSRPGMSWHAAQKAAAAALRGGGHRKSTTTVTHKKRKTHSVGSTAVGRTRHKSRKKKGWFGATSATQGRIAAIGEIAIGIGVGAAATHLLLRPLEHKITQHFTHPMVAKGMPWGEIALGGLMFIMSPHKLVRNAGLGVMSSGVHGAMKQLPFHMHSPSETINGVGEYTQIRIPVNGTLKEAISGLIQDDNRYVRTPTVGDSIIKNDDGRPVKTSVVSGHYATLNRTSTVGDYSPEDEMLFRTNLYKR